MKRFIGVVGICLMLLSACSPSQASPNEESSGKSESENIVTLDIYGSTDFAGAMIPSEYNAGSAVFGAYLKHLKAQNPEGTIILDAGDSLVGTPIAYYFQGKPIIEAMNNVGYDAMEIGNHEFDWGIGEMKDALNMAGFPILCANIYNKSDGSRVDFTEPYVIIEKAGVKVGIIGFLPSYTSTLVTYPHIKDFDFTDPIEEANKLIPKMRSEGAEIIIALTHLPIYLQEDGSFKGDAMDFANQVEDVDLIIAGHMWDSFADKVNGKPMFQTAHYGNMIGHISIEFDTISKKVINSRVGLIDVLNGSLDVEPDTEIKEIVAKYSADLDVVFGEVIGTASESMPIDMIKEIGLGHWWTDSIKEATGVQITFVNSSGLFESIEPGPITLGKIFSISPFDNYLVKAEMTGKQLKQLFEVTYDSTRVQENGSLQVAGLKLVYNSSNPDYEKVISMTLADGTPIDMESKYTVATIDFLAYGGNGYMNLTEITWEDTGLFARDIYIEYLRNLGTVSNETDGRLTDLAE